MLRWMLGAIEMRKAEECKLCGNHAKLTESHVIPKFVINWLKQTSATGYIRQGINPNLRKQDLAKLKLLCAVCETRFSRWEKRFAEDIFIPYQTRRQQSFRYDQWLLLFVVSLAWRTVIVEIESFQKNRSKELEYRRY